MSDVELLNMIQELLRKAARGEDLTLAEAWVWREFHRDQDPVIRAAVKPAATASVDVDDLVQEVGWC